MRGLREGGRRGCCEEWARSGYHAASGWRIHCGVEVTELSTNKQHTLSGPGAARTILLFHIISARPSKQPRMVGSTFGVYSFGLIFVSARTNKRHHYHHDLVLHLAPTFPPPSVTISKNDSH